MDNLWIYDRTTADIANDTDKRYVLYTDLNRIEQRMRELSDALNKNIYPQVIHTKTDWEYQGDVSSRDNIPTLSHLNRMRENMQILIDAFYTYPTTPKLPESFENLTIYSMNDIEKILHDLHYLIEGMKSEFIYCDTVYCSE